MLGFETTHSIVETTYAVDDIIGSEERCGFYGGYDQFI